MNDIKNINIKEYIKLICSTLGIDVPKLVYTNKHFASDTQMAYYKTPPGKPTTLVVG